MASQNSHNRMLGSSRLFSNAAIETHAGSTGSAYGKGTTNKISQIKWVNVERISSLQGHKRINYVKITCEIENAVRLSIKQKPNAILFGVVVCRHRASIVIDLPM